MTVFRQKIKNSFVKCNLEFEGIFCIIYAMYNIPFLTPFVLQTSMPQVRGKCH